MEEESRGCSHSWAVSGTGISLDTELCHEPQHSPAVLRRGGGSPPKHILGSYISGLALCTAQISSKYLQKQFCSPGQMREENMTIFICFDTYLGAEVGLGRFTGLILAPCPGMNYTLKY